MEYVHAARLITERVRSYSAEVLPLVRDLADALLDVLLVSLRLIAALSRPVIAAVSFVCLLFRPIATAMLFTAWRKFATQTPQALAAEAAGTGAIAFLLLLEQRFGVIAAAWRSSRRVARRVAQFYSDVKRSVREKSRLAAAVLAHALFIVPVVLLLFFIGPAVDSFSRSWGLFMASFAYPAYWTIAALYSMEIEENMGVSSPSTGVDSARHTPVGLMKAVENTPESLKEDENESTPERRALFADPLTNSPSDVTGSVTARSTDTSTQKKSKEIRVTFRERNTSNSSGVVPSKVASNGSSRIRGDVLERASSSGSSCLVERLFSRSDEEHLLRFWCVYGIAWTARGLVRYFMSGILGRFLTRLDTFLFFFLLWLQLEFTHGTELIFPFVATAMRQGQQLRPNVSHAEQLNIFLRMLVAIGLVQAESAAIVGSTITESGLALAGVVFFITPRVVTYIGTLLIGLMVPVYLTVSAASPSSISITRHTWLSYWAVYGLIEAIYSSVAGILNWVPLWYHAKLALILWLQLPYYRGAALLLDRAVGRIGRLVSLYKRKNVTPRKRKQA